MKRTGLLVIICSLVLSGCWDERQYKDVTNVALAGIEGRPGKIESQFAFPIYENGTISYTTVKGKGFSVRGSKNATNTAEGLDVAELQVLFLSSDSAKQDIYQYLDVLYRDPRNRLNAHLAIVEGELAPYFEANEAIGDDLSTYYSELIKTANTYTLVPKINLQQTCTLLFSEDISLALPYIKIGKESAIPEIAGTAIFSGKEFTGLTLDVKESMLLNLLMNKKAKYARKDFLWEKGEKKSPLAINVLNIKKNWGIANDKIDATYKLTVSIEEFPHDSLNKKKTVKEVEDFLSKELEKDFTKIIHKLQEVKSDAVGFGRSVRAFHPELWKKGEWLDTFSDLPINIKVKVDVTRSGILN